MCAWGHLQLLLYDCISACVMAIFGKHCIEQVHIDYTFNDRLAKQPFHAWYSINTQQQSKIDTLLIHANNQTSQYYGKYFKAG
jgi:hypothetical protein